MNLKVPPHVEIKQKLFKWNREINRGYERCICRYCNSMAMKKNVYEWVYVFFYL